jgi:NtrC-family two-component system sensor histidine kinase KinB
MQRLFQTVRDGVFIVSPDGTVRFVNEAAACLMPCRAGSRLPNAALLRLIDSANAGHLRVPHSGEIELDEGAMVVDVDTVRAHLLRSPVGEDYVVVLHNVTEEQFYATGMDNFARLVDREYRDALVLFEAEFGVLLSILAHDATEATPAQLADFQRLVGEGRELLAGLGRLARLTQIAGGSAVVGEDRIDLLEMFADAIGRCMDEAERRQVRLHIEKPEQELPRVYASRLWLGQALTELVDNAVRHGPPKSDVVIGCRPNDAFVVIGVSNVGRSLPPRLRGRLLQPGFRGKAAAGRKTPAFGLGLTLARKVVELHGGRLLIEEGSDDQMVSFGLELPCGGRSATGREFDLQQTQRYAQDLAALMRRKSLVH